MRSLTDAFIAVLEAGGLQVGDGSSDGLTVPYVVVYPFPQTRDGSIGDPFSDVAKWMGATGWGKSRYQAEWVADRVEQLLDESDLVITEMVRDEAVRDDTTAQPSLWMAPCRALLRAYAT